VQVLMTYSLSAGRTSKYEKQTFWVMSPPKIQSWTSTKGVQFLSVVKKILKAEPRSKIGLQKFRVMWKHLKRGIGGGNIEGPLKTVDKE
jgi:hypothetical protein